MSIFPRCLPGIVAIAATAVPSSALAAQRSVWIVSSGATYSKGDYGDVSATRVLAVPFSLTYRRGGLKLRVSLPWVSIRGPGSLIDTDRGGGGGGSTSGGGPGPSGGGGGGGGSGSGDVGGSDDSGGGSGGGGGSTGRTGHRSGIGDLSVAAVYSFDLGKGLSLEPGVKVKLPTASRAKRIGTGKTDVTVSSDIVKEIGNATIYAGARRRFTGKPAGSNLRSIWGAGAGASFRASQGVFVGADYDWQQSSTRGRGPSSEITGWTSFRMTRQARLTFSATTGFTRNSADFAGAAILSWRL